MKSPFSIRALMLLALCLMTASAAYGQETCSEVLRDGTMKKANYKHKVLLRLLLEAKYARTDFQESRTKKEFGLDVPIGEAVIGANTSEAGHSVRKQRIESSLNVDYLLNNETKVAVSSGDPEIVGAWLKCMQQKDREFIVWFELLDPRTALLHMQYNHGKHQLGDVALTKGIGASDVPKGVRVDDKNRCLRKGKEFLSGNKCTVDVRLDSAKTPFVMTISTGLGSRSAYLPPRMVLNAYPEPFTLGKEKSAEARSSRENKLSEPMCFTAPDGYFIDVKATRVQHHSTGKPECLDPNNPKHKLINYPGQHRVCFQVFARPKAKEGGDAVCKGFLTGEIVKYQWDPDGGI